MPFVYVVVCYFQSEYDNYEHTPYEHTSIQGVYDSQVLAEYQIPQDDKENSFKIEKLEIQNSKSLIEKLKADLDNLEAANFCNL